MGLVSGAAGCLAAMLAIDLRAGLFAYLVPALLAVVAAAPRR